MKTLSKLLLTLLLLMCFESLEAQPRRYTISGQVMDATSEEPLLGATIYDGVRSVGTSTNEYGFYSLTLPEGRVRLEISYVGYAPEVRELELTGDVSLNFLLHSDVNIEQVVVYGDRRFSGAQSSQMGAIEVPIAQIQSAPTLFGEQDVLKSLQLLPGVQAGSEGSAGIYVRGGGQDENLMLLDGVPIYNVNHMMGFFSAFNPDAIKSVTLFKGSFPARFSSRLSSVIDVRTKDGDMYAYHGNVSVGAISSKVNIEGPLWKGHTSFNLSLRRTYSDVLMVPAMMGLTSSILDTGRAYGGYYFYDLNAKITHKFSDTDRLYLSLYSGDDAVYFNVRDSYTTGDSGSSEETRLKMDWKWGNMVASARWNHLLSPRLFMDASLTYTRYRNDMALGTEAHSTTPQSTTVLDMTMGADSGIEDLSAKVDMTWTPSTEHSVRFGAAYVNHKFSPDVTVAKMSLSLENLEPENSTVPDTLITLDEMFGQKLIRAHEAVLYVEDELSLGENLQANVGLNYSGFAVDGEFYHSLQPRLSARLMIADGFSAKAGYAYMTQYVHLLSNNSISLPSDLWVPVTERIKPMSSSQLSAGLFYDIPGLFDISVEGYYKTMDNLLEYKDGASLMATTSGWEDKVCMGRGWAYGVEFLLQRSVGRTTGWIGYTWAKSMRLFDKEGQVLNGGQPFPAKYDRRHDVSITISHKLTDNIDLSATWVYNTGNCATLATQYYEALPYDLFSQQYMDHGYRDYISSRNNYRYDPYHRLDLSLSFHKQKRYGVRTWNISVYNAYNNMNPFLMYPSYENYYEEMPDGGVMVSSKNVFKKLTIFPILPSVTYSYKF